jgi:hypothetical protein
MQDDTFHDEHGKQSIQPHDPDSLAQYINDDEFGFVAAMLSSTTFSMVKQIVHFRGPVTYLHSTFEFYTQKHLDRKDTRYVISPRLYASLSYDNRANFRRPDCSWALCNQDTNTNFYHLFAMRPQHPEGPRQPSEPLNPAYERYLCVSNMDEEKFEKLVENIGGIPYYSFYIH